MWCLYWKNGSSLPLDWNLCWQKKSKVFLYFFNIIVNYNYNHNCYVYNDDGGYKRRSCNIWRKIENISYDDCICNISMPSWTNICWYYGRLSYISNCNGFNDKIGYRLKMVNNCWKPWTQIKLLEKFNEISFKISIKQIQI